MTWVSGSERFGSPARIEAETRSRGRREEPDGDDGAELVDREGLLADRPAPSRRATLQRATREARLLAERGHEAAGDGHRRDCVSERNGDSGNEERLPVVVSANLGNHEADVGEPMFDVDEPRREKSQNHQWGEHA